VDEFLHYEKFSQDASTITKRVGAYD